MKQRRESLTRLVEIQEKLNRLHAWRLAALDQRRAALEEAQKATIETIDRDAIANGVLVASATRRLRNVETQMARLEPERAAQAERARAQAVRAKLAERLAHEAEASHRMQRERVELGELIEHSLARKTASPA